MEHEAIRTIMHKGYKISIHQDVNFDKNPNEWNENIQLVYDHEYFYVKSDYVDFDPYETFKRYESGYKTHDRYYFFPVYAYIHSGVLLSLGRNGYPFTDQWDVSFKGFIYVKKNKEAYNMDKAFKLAELRISVWNNFLNGYVFGYIIEDSEGNEIDSCWGFIGDTDYCLQEAKGIIDRIEVKRIARKESELNAIQQKLLYM